MQCAQCQADNPPQAKFCMECAAPIALKCTACGAELPTQARFCVECAHPVSLPTPPSATPAPSPETYTPKHLAERILTSRAALEGERKQVTVLFADLKGSMELLADRDPEEARAILDPVLERMMDAVHRYEGTVNQVMGDGIMALFGAPLAHEDHAVRACYAALRMQQAVKQYADEVRRTQGVLIQIRIGLNSGEVVVRSIGSDLRMDYTAVGQTAHLAARMEQLAAPGSILLALDTVQLAEGYVQVTALGPMSVKGLPAPVEVYELLGAGTARSRLQAAAARGLTRFVGRDAELATLRRTLDQARTGHGQIVALVGEPGVGKSRLVWEFSHSHRTQGWLVLEGGSVSYGKATSYLPVIDLLKSYCDVEARDDPRRVREKLTGKVLTLDPALQPTLPAFLALLDVPVDDAPWQALDPPQRRQRTLDACKRLILRESQEQPLLLVFEDLHWIDAETQALLDSLVESLPTARILLLVNYRPEYEHAWHRKTYYQQLRLDPLPPENAESLLAALVGDAAELQPLKSLLIRRTEGNPFFIEESVRTLVEGGVLAGERGSYRPAKPFASTEVPATVQAVLAARIDRLAPEDKRLLQTAAILGKDVSYALLQAIAELPDAALRQGLARLHAAEFLYETSIFPDLEYTFKHALTHEVAYGSLLQARRQALHARIVEAIEALYTDRFAEQVERLAHHAFRGQVWAKAVTYLGQAAQRATARSANREAVEYLEHAIDAVGELAPTREVREHAIDLRLELRNAALLVREFDRALRAMQEAETLAIALDDQLRLGRVLARLATDFWIRGDHKQAVEYGQRALTIATTLCALDLEVQTSHTLNQVSYSLGDYRRAVQFNRRQMGLLTGGQFLARCGQPHFPSVISRSWLTLSLAELGEFTEGLAQGQEAIRIAESVDHPFSLAAALSAVSCVHISQGDFLMAVPLLERSLEISRGRNVPLLVALHANFLGYALAMGGRPTNGIPALEQALEQTTVMGSGYFHGPFLTRLGEAYLRAGRLTDAAEMAESGLSYVQAHGERGHEAWALRLLGQIGAHADPPDAEQAHRYYRQALALAEELGMRPLAAHCHLGLGTLYRKVGRDEQAQVKLTTAAEMYRAMEMTFWLGRAEAELGHIESTPERT